MDTRAIFTDRLCCWSQFETLFLDSSGCSLSNEWPFCGEFRIYLDFDTKRSKNWLRLSVDRIVVIPISSPAHCHQCVCTRMHVMYNAVRNSQYKGRALISLTVSIDFPFSPSKARFSIPIDVRVSCADSVSTSNEMSLWNAMISINFHSIEIDINSTEFQFTVSFKLPFWPAVDRFCVAFDMVVRVLWNGNSNKWRANLSLSSRVLKALDFYYGWQSTILLKQYSKPAHSQSTKFYNLRLS